MKILTQLAFWLAVIGGLNWGLIGLFHWDLVASLFGEMSLMSRLIYILVGISAVWLVIDYVSTKPMEKIK